MTDIITAIPWACLLIVFGGMAALQWRALSGLDDLAKLLAQILGQSSPRPMAVPSVAAPAARPPVVPAAVPPVAPAPAPTVPSAPKPATAAAAAGTPTWVTWALHEVGFHETGNNQGIEKYIAAGKCGSLGDPWCAIFANAALESSGVPGTRSASSQSFRNDPNFVQLAGPAPGAIVVFWRISKASGQGHVGFYRGEDATRVWTLGGNENDMVQIEALPKDSASFGLIGYWWPKSVPLPQIGAVQMPAGSPVSMQTASAGSQATGVNNPLVAPAGRQTNIVATVFGGEASAYGGMIHDDQPGVALPFRFPASGRPRVRVINAKTRAAVECDIVDVGPWNINDPYWQTGARPQAEAGTDMGQTGRVRPTNKAGIDLTAAAASAIQIDGKGLVDWEFITESPIPQASNQTPNVV